MEPEKHVRPLVVTVKFSVSPADQEEFTMMVQEMIMEIGPFLASQPGFIAFRCNRSLDGASVVNQLVWKSQADHEASMAAPEMEAAAGAIAEWVETGRAPIETEIYEQVSSIG